MRATEILIVGGSAAGITAALTARRHYPDKSILVVRQEQQVLVPCGIPYIFGTLGGTAKNLVPDALLEKAGVSVACATVMALDLAGRAVHTSGEAVAYDRLVLATGSLPVRLPVPGAEKDGVYPVYKDVAHLDALQARIKDATNVVVIGGGFIGIEFADEIQKLGGKTVTVLEVAPHCLSLAYDEEFCTEMEAAVQARGVHVRTSVMVAELQGNGKVTAVKLADGTVIPADVVIFGIGAMPNVELARTVGIALGPTGAIAVDRTMRTSHEHVFACGDCAEKISFFGGRPSTLRLAAIATLEARIAGANLYGIHREHDGTVGVWSTAVGNLAMATAGLTETVAHRNGYDCVAVTVEGPNRHPGGMPGGAATKLKLVNTCPECGKRVRRLPGTGAGFIMKGTPFQGSSSSCPLESGGKTCCDRATRCGTAACGGDV